ncbi:Protein mab-21-like 3 [Amphibalanus amphitrite]|uniref:Protein mab-21-like 3 n=1 Tax=Amphibalanus amphitrite TaxID=1232801 RepID=A0A6A4VS59_AMPAM|nr:Protein mab-21-like 3 [Amphibalanus amphitrite]
MGVGCSRCCSDSRHSSLAPSTIPSQRPSGNGSAGSGASSYEQEREEALRLLRDEFKRRPTVFLISQILMSVQFFKNFNRDKLRILQLKEEKEEELNRALQKDKKSAAYLGSPYEVIGEVMAYCRRDGDEPCLGHDLEYLIMHDSIAVRTPSDELSPEEEARTYQFIMQRCRSEGYTRLRQTGRIPAPTIHRSRRSDIKSREWSHQSPLKESETEPGAKDRTSSGSAASPERTPDAEAAPPAKERQGAAVEKSGANATPVGSPSGSTDREGKAKSAAGAAKEAALGDRRRSRGADSSGDDSEGTSSSSLASAAGKRQFQPGMSPYQQFVGPYPMASPPVGWSPEQMMLGSQQPYMPGVPLANQNPAVGFGMPGMPGQPVPPGYLGAGHPYMHPAPMSTGHHLNTISEGRANTKPRRAGAEAKRHTSDVSSSHLMPPSQHHGRRKSRSKSNASLLAPVDSRRQSTSSSTSRLSFLDSTTTDEEGDTPGLVPHHCFRKLKMRVDTGDDDDEDVWHEPHYVTHRFLSSERFLGVFADRFGELVQLMARDAWLQHGGRGLLNGAVVQCREVLPSGLRTTARITATLQVSSWPSEHAFEWALRKRTELIDARNQWRFVWPPQRVVQNVLQEVGCNLVPLASQKGRAAELEWEIAFQQAEIKLISSLGLVHVHCWAAAKLFFTHFLSEFGCLQERHIRHLMFWQFENNFRDWRLEGLGATFVGLLSALKESVRERRLEHYFIRKRNLLQNESTGDLVSAQEKIQRVMENLLPNIIILMSRLQIRNKAFPTLDWQNLYDTLRMSTTDIMKKLIPELSISPDGELPRVEMVLSLFIRHFNAMAERLIEHESIYTALAYIDHSPEPMASGSGRASQDHSNWTVGPEKGPAARRDFNREAATATAGDMAEWQAQGGVRPETEGGDQAERTGSGSLFDGPALFGEMRVNPAFVEDQPKADEDGAESDDAEVSRSGLRTSRGEADWERGPGRKSARSRRRQEQERVTRQQRSGDRRRGRGRRRRRGGGR